jgi:hypothetical protein
MAVAGGALPAYLPIALPKRYPKMTHVEGAVTFLKNSTSNPLRIDPSGLLLGLLVTFNGTLVTGATAPVPINGSPYSVVNRVTLTVGGGVSRTIDVSAYELNAVERTREADYVDDPSAPVVVSTTNVWKYAFFVPVCVRDGDLYSQWTDLLGAIWTGDPTITCTITFQFLDENSLFTNQGAAAATLAGTFTITSMKLDTPTPDLDSDLLRAISWSHVVIEERNDSGANQMPYLMPTNEPRVYMRIWNLYGDTAAPNFAYKNGVLTTWDLNLQDYIHFFDTVPEQVLLEQQLRRYTVALPVGTYIADFAASMYRTQWMPVDRVTLFKNQPTIPTPGGNAHVFLVQESLVPSPLARKWIIQAAQAGNFKLVAA